MKRRVIDLINQQGLKDCTTVGPDDSISDTFDVLLVTNCSAVLSNGSTLSDKVESIMTLEDYYAEPNFTLKECLQIQIMSKVHVRHLPVMDKDTSVAMY